MTKEMIQITNFNKSFMKLLLDIFDNPYPSKTLSHYIILILYSIQFHLFFIHLSIYCYEREEGKREKENILPCRLEIFVPYTL